MNTRETERTVRQALRLLEAQQTGAAYSVNQPPIQEMETLVDDLVVQMREVIDKMAQPYRLWNAGGVGATVVAASELSDAPEGSRYTKEYWLMAQAVFNLFRIWTNLSMDQITALSLDVNGETVQPFAAIDVSGIDGSLTPNHVISMQPQEAE